MNKQIFLTRKAEAERDNLLAFKEQVKAENPCANTIAEYVRAVKSYNKRNFESTERLVNIIYSQRGMRSISSSQSVIHALHQMRNR